MSNVMTANEHLSRIALTQPTVLDQAQSIFTAMLDHSPDAVLILDQHQQVVFVSQALMMYLDLSRRHHVYGQLLSDIFRCRDEDELDPTCNPTEPCEQCGIVRAINTGIIGNVATQEIRLLQSDQTIREMRISTRSFMIRNQQFSMCTLQDITAERHRLQLDRMFFHDVLNTAGLVKGYADILRGASDDELEMIQEQLSRTSTRLINEIETQRILNAAENNDLHVEWSSENAGGLLDDLQAEYTRHEVARERSLQIVGSVDVTLTTDPTLLGRVLGNLIKNALEASAPGEVVSLGCWHEGATVVFTVHNPAVIPDHVKRHIFKRTISTKGQGRGIGTYSAHLLTERYLNGHIDFTTAADEGTTFSVTYPL